MLENVLSNLVMTDYDRGLLTLIPVENNLTQWTYKNIYREVAEDFTAAGTCEGEVVA